MVIGILPLFDETGIVPLLSEPKSRLYDRGVAATNPG
jgi:hypothetical protein